MYATQFCKLFAVLACGAALSRAAQQHLRFDEDTYVYELTFDDTRIPVADMRQIAWLSPYVGVTPDFLIGMTVETVDGKAIWDKTLMAPELELCPQPLLTGCSQTANVADQAFLRNADRNLKLGLDQIEKLRRKKMPAGLEPVRAYLLDSLRRSSEMEKARYEYLKSGDAGPLRRLLCRVCACAGEKEMLNALTTTSDPRQRFELARFRWHNEVLRCERKRNTAIYPMGAWNRFLTDYGITESRRSLHID